MIESIFLPSAEAVRTSPLLLTLAVSMLSGTLSFFSPCVLPMLPTYFLLLTQEKSKDPERNVPRIHLADETDRDTSFYPNIIAFLLGFSLIFCLLGAVAASLGEHLMQYREILEKIAAIILILFSLFLSGFWKPAFLLREKRPFLGIQVTGKASAFLFGASFSIGWTPCTGPILSFILLLAGTSGTITIGILLLVAYTLGFSLPFLLLAFLYRRLNIRFQSLYQCIPYLQKFAALLLFLFAILLWRGETLWLTSKLLHLSD